MTSLGLLEKALVAVAEHTLGKIRQLHDGRTASLSNVDLGKLCHACATVAMHMRNGNPHYPSFMEKNESTRPHTTCRADMRCHVHATEQ